MKKDIFITLADKGYLEQAKQLFYGAATKGGWEGDMMLLAYQAADADLSWFEDRGIIVYHCPQWDVKGGTNGSYEWPPVVWHKMHIFKPYFRQWRTIVFSDVDIIIRSSIRQLADVEAFSAVKCNSPIRSECIRPLSAYLSGRDWRLLREVDRKYDLDRIGFNSGFMAFPSLSIEDGFFEKAVFIQQAYGSLFMIPEQVTTNLLISKWNALPSAYSMYPIDIASYTHMKPGDIEGVAIHFILERPWVEGHPFYKEWKESYDKACSTEDFRSSEPVVTMTDDEIRGIESKMETEFRKGRLKRFRKSVFDGLERSVGICGMAIKKVSPRLYAALKRN